MSAFIDGGYYCGRLLEGPGLPDRGVETIAFPNLAKQCPAWRTPNKWSFLSHEGSTINGF